MAPNSRRQKERISPRASTFRRKQLLYKARAFEMYVCRRRKRNKVYYFHILGNEWRNTVVKRTHWRFFVYSVGKTQRPQSCLGSVPALVSCGYAVTSHRRQQRRKAVLQQADCRLPTHRDWLDDHEENRRLYTL